MCCSLRMLTKRTSSRRFRRCRHSARRAAHTQGAGTAPLQPPATSRAWSVRRRWSRRGRRSCGCAWGLRSGEASQGSCRPCSSSCSPAWLSATCGASCPSGRQTLRRRLRPASARWPSTRAASGPPSAGTRRWPGSAGTPRQRRRWSGPASWIPRTRPSPGSARRCARGLARQALAAAQPPVPLRPESLQVLRRQGRRLARCRPPCRTRLPRRPGTCR
mmetsp:Transcript_62348/g.201040  ORF Transcript_62348/g.201040 Transcript_62348/m.201040 type:complete len:218 (-) Transcript_62348:450-1103(-)